MGKNNKERARYAYTHETKAISYMLLQRIKRQFWRLNWDIGKARKQRIDKRNKQLNKE